MDVRKCHVGFAREVKRINDKMYNTSCLEEDRIVSNDCHRSVGVKVRRGSECVVDARVRRLDKASAVIGLVCRRRRGLCMYVATISSVLGGSGGGGARVNGRGMLVVSESARSIESASKSRKRTIGTRTLHP
jgi:hypothetical protein